MKKPRLQSVVAKSTYQDRDRRYPKGGTKPVPHPHRKQVIAAGAKKIELHMTAGNFYAAHAAIDAVNQELQSWHVSMDDPVTSLDFDGMLLSWLERNGFGTIRSLAEASDDDFTSRPRFARTWLPVIREAVGKVK